jgi:hypothetical protein
MMQEHRSLIKRASMEQETAGLASTNFEKHFGIFVQILNESIYEGALFIL